MAEALWGGGKIPWNVSGDVNIGKWVVLTQCRGMMGSDGYIFPALLEMMNIISIFVVSQPIAQVERPKASRKPVHVE